MKKAVNNLLVEKGRARRGQAEKSTSSRKKREKGDGIESPDYGGGEWIYVRVEVRGVRGGDDC